MKKILVIVLMTLGLNLQAKTNLGVYCETTTSYTENNLLVETKPRMSLGLEFNVLNGFDIETAYSLTTADEGRGEINFYTSLNDSVKLLNGINAKSLKQLDGFQIGLKIKDTLFIEYLKNSPLGESTIIGITITLE